MSEFPDIDTSQVGFIGYWNAIDQGGLSSVSPSEVTSARGIVSTESYDNGVQGDYEFRNGRVGRYRVKTDGWFVVWMDRTHDSPDGAGSNLDDDHDLVYWNGILDASHGDYNSVGNGADPDLQQNSLAYSIYELWNELSNSSGVNWSYGDVGLYNYEYSGSQATTFLFYSGTNKTASLTRQTGTDRYAHICSWQAASDDSDGSRSISFDGSTLSSRGGFYGLDVGAHDLISLGLGNNDGTGYDTSTNVGTQSSHENHQTIVWG